MKIDLDDKYQSLGRMLFGQHGCKSSQGCLSFFIDGRLSYLEIIKHTLEVMHQKNKSSDKDNLHHLGLFHKCA